MLTAALNTMGYMGGSPFDKDGLDTYQLQGWDANAVLTKLNFIRVEGDANKVQLEVYDRPFGSDAKKLYSEVLNWRTQKVYNPPVQIKGARLDRLYLRLIALDGEKQNHCQAVFFGEVENAA